MSVSFYFCASILRPNGLLSCLKRPLTSNLRLATVRKNSYNLDFSEPLMDILAPREFQSSLIASFSFMLLQRY